MELAVTCHFAPPLTKRSEPSEKSGSAERPTKLEQEAILRSIPALRRFAKSLTRDFDRANDLVQETLLRGITNIRQFQPGTNMAAWLMTILRNFFLSQLRKERYEIADEGAVYANTIPTKPNQISSIELRDLQKALPKLSADQRKALLLIFVYGHSYLEAAAMCGCPAGTIKSRANRARALLCKLTQRDHVAEFSPGDEILVAVTASASAGPASQQLN